MSSNVEISQAESVQPVEPVVALTKCQRQNQKNKAKRLAKKLAEKQAAAPDLPKIESEEESNSSELIVSKKKRVDPAPATQTKKPKKPKKAAKKVILSMKEEEPELRNSPLIDDEEIVISKAEAEKTFKKPFKKPFVKGSPNTCGKLPQRVVKDNSSAKPSAAVVSHAPNKVQTFFGMCKSTPKITDEIEKICEEVLRVPASEGWIAVDVDSERDLVMISADKNGNLQEVAHLRGVIVDTKERRIVADSFGYGLSVISSEIELIEQPANPESSFETPLPSRFYRISGPPALTPRAEPVVTTMITENTMLTTTFEGMVVRIYKIRGEILLANHNKISISGGKRKIQKFKNGKTETVEVKIAPSQMEGQSFHEMTIKALGFPIEELFSPEVETSQIVYTFMIIAPVFALANSIEFTEPFAVILETSTPQQVVDERDQPKSFEDAPMISKRVETSQVYNRKMFTFEEAQKHLKCGFYEDDGIKTDVGYSNQNTSTCEGVLAVEFFRTPDGTLSKQIKNLLHISPPYYESKISMYDKDTSVPMTDANRAGRLDAGHSSEFNPIRKIERLFEGMETRFGSSVAPMHKKGFHEAFAAKYYPYDTSLTNDDLLRMIEENGIVRTLPTHPSRGHVIPEPEDASVYYRKQIWLNYFVAAPFCKQKMIAKMSIETPTKVAALTAWITSKILELKDGYASYIQTLFPAEHDKPQTVTVKTYLLNNFVHFAEQSLTKEQLTPLINATVAQLESFGAKKSVKRPFKQFSKDNPPAPAVDNSSAAFALKFALKAEKNLNRLTTLTASNPSSSSSSSSSSDPSGSSSVTPDCSWSE